MLSWGTGRAEFLDEHKSSFIIAMKRVQPPLFAESIPRNYTVKPQFVPPIQPTTRLLSGRGRMKY